MGIRDFSVGDGQAFPSKESLLISAIIADRDGNKHAMAISIDIIERDIPSSYHAVFWGKCQH